MLESSQALATPPSRQGKGWAQPGLTHDPKGAPFAVDDVHLWSAGHGWEKQCYPLQHQQQQQQHHQQQQQQLGQSLLLHFVVQMLLHLDLTAAVVLAVGVHLLKMQVQGSEQLLQLIAAWCANW